MFQEREEIERLQQQENAGPQQPLKTSRDAQVDEGWTLSNFKTRWRYYVPVFMWLPTYNWRADLLKGRIWASPAA